MDETAAWAGVLWLLGAYLAGSLPSTYLIARLRGRGDLIAAAGRESGETDPHILMTRDMGAGWSTAGATVDVVKGIAVPLLARHAGGVESGWLALVGVAVVIGHAWPPYARAMAGRGLAAASGVYLALLPVPMVVMGSLIVAGVLGGETSLASTVGLLAVPATAALQGQPVELVAMAAAILCLVVVRRLEGVGSVVSAGVSRPRAVWYRVVFDSSGPRVRDAQAEREEPGSAT